MGSLSEPRIAARIVPKKAQTAANPKKSRRPTGCSNRGPVSWLLGFSLMLRSLTHESSAIDCSRQAQLHGSEYSLEGIENQAEVLQGYGPEEGLIIVALAEDHRGVAVLPGQRDVTFGNVPGDRDAIDQGKRDIALGFQAQGLPNFKRQQGITGTAINQEFHLLLLT
jgi:hypothetical protein